MIISISEEFGYRYWQWHTYFENVEEFKSWWDENLPKFNTHFMSEASIPGVLILQSDLDHEEIPTEIDIICNIHEPEDSSYHICDMHSKTKEKSPEKFNKERLERLKQRIYACGLGLEGYDEAEELLEDHLEEIIYMFDAYLDSL